MEVYHPVLYKSKALGRFLETYRPGIDEGIDELWNYLHSPWYTSWSYGGEGVILTFSLKDNAYCDAIGSNEEKEYVKDTPSLWLASALCVIDRLTDYMERRINETKGHSREPEQSLQQCG